MINGIFISLGFCLLAEYFSNNYENKYLLIAMISHVSYELLDIISICYSSQNIINSMKLLTKVTEKRLINQSLSMKEYILTKVVVGLRKQIRFTAWTLFDLKSVTILMIFGYIANYTVILIQTTDF